ncbi:hypothetical protein PR048_009859 [Dryococelus australis]|uniref:Secreted protein n=1 Tax=Dryococelus australis TaxID=614101 RepID=A0ABQ9I134_9NEOP|nr:hypothetical protein PR048_009859 [Dryococelus australis]
MRLHACGQVLGYLCAMEALLLSLVTRYHSVQYAPVDEDPSQVTLQEHRHDSCPPSPSLQLQLVPAPLPSWPVDDIQPCSSKCTNPYPVP